jgi:CHAT domain-containing protein
LISPDHLLWIVPWAALPESADRLVVERHEVQYVLSGRDLLTLPTAESKAVPLIVANPKYGSGSSGTSQDIAFVPLPGTQKEAQGVLPYLRRLGGAEPNVFVGPKAQESVVKTAKRPKVALFSTHGFAGVSPDQHPMATCGLAFTNANAAIEGNGDGVLTGLEILASDYRGTELVVLSACQTALGDISSGEGVASLRYAFQLAGARNVAGTLWSIPDAITAEMMKDFFKQYSAGQTPAAALRIAQLATIRRLESQGGIADPALWAAFTIAGPPATETTRNGSIKTWRSANGKYTIEAKLISVEGQRVVLRKLDGAEIQVPFSQLHQDDREKIARAIGQSVSN